MNFYDLYLFLYLILFFSFNEQSYNFLLLNINPLQKFRNLKTKFYELYVLQSTYLFQNGLIGAKKDKSAKNFTNI